MRFTGAKLVWGGNASATGMYLLMQEKRLRVRSFTAGVRLALLTHKLRSDGKIQTRKITRRVT